MVTSDLQVSSPGSVCVCIVFSLGLWIIHSWSQSKGHGKQVLGVQSVAGLFDLLSLSTTQNLITTCSLIQTLSHCLFMWPQSTSRQFLLLPLAGHHLRLASQSLTGLSSHRPLFLPTRLREVSVCHPWGKCPLPQVPSHTADTLQCSLVPACLPLIFPLVPRSPP